MPPLPSGVPRRRLRSRRRGDGRASFGVPDRTADAFTGTRRGVSLASRGRSGGQRRVLCSAGRGRDRGIRTLQTAVTGRNPPTP